ncbi:MAG: hypothetical protein V2I57_14040 [Xanthomonadales bacterium]|jgi:hypothetical protein|nr:hypothetical protein [Xanthomonadales bacterium]
MSIIKDGGDPGVAPPAPLFASSWIALFLQLRHNLESLRASNEDALNRPEPLDTDPDPLDRTGSD